MPLCLTRTTQAAFIILLLLASFAHAEPEQNKDAQTVLHMLDYVSVDYGSTVLLGKVLNESEFTEQVGFAEQAAKLLGGLPEHPRHAILVMEALELAHSVQAKVPPDDVSNAAQKLRRSIIEIYQVPVSPKTAPTLTTAMSLYERECASCHGAHGHGDGPDGINLNPKPADFHNAPRMSQLSVYGLYNTISLGVSGTAMRSFTKLSDEERWALAFLVSNMRIPPERVEQGRRLWEQREFRGSVPDLVALTTLTANEVASRHGDRTRAVLDYLRTNPQALSPSRYATLLLAAEQLDNALTHYREGDYANARRSAIAAYLEGFEPMELSLDSLDSRLRRDIEREMLAVRQLMDDKAPIEKTAQKVKHAKELLKQADELLRAGKLSVGSAFASSMFVLLREGMESILLLATIMALVVKIGQRKALTYIHSGWSSATILSIFTLVAATWLIDVSGATREITEGITALVAATLLVYLGFWLRNKAQSWPVFMHDPTCILLERKMLWILALIAFLAVSREIFETVLFYQALWAQTNESAKHGLWGGMTTAIMILAISGWGLFRLAIKLPLRIFLFATSILLAILAIIFSGQGVAALQEAGIVTKSLVSFASLPILGIFPTFQTLLTQVSVIGILILCYGLPTRRHLIQPKSNAET